VTALPALAADRQAGVKPEVPGAPVFVDLQPIVLPVIEGDAVTRQVGILLTLELAEGQPAAGVEAKRRQLTDAFITELYRLYGWRAEARRVVDEALLKQRLQATADRVLGQGVVRAILIRQLIEQEP
jgi:flagellar FliL protein